MFGNIGKKILRKSITWIPPPLNFAKLNFDGLKLRDGQVSFGIVICYDQENVILCRAISISFTYSILIAGAWGLRRRITKLTIEDDNMAVIQSIKIL